MLITGFFKLLGSFPISVTVRVLGFLNSHYSVFEPIHLLYAKWLIFFSLKYNNKML